MEATQAAHARLWTRGDYEDLASQGFLRSDERLELIDGIIYSKSQQTPLDATGILLLIEALRSAFPNGYSIRTLLPLALGAYSQPAPDVSVVSGTWRDHVDDHPTKAVLIAEVSDTSSFHDRERKKSLYARSDIPEYWIVDMVGRQLVVYRNPGEGGYQTRLILKAGDTIAPLASPEAAIAVADLLP
jgi:Uma2 family endonuclease